MTKQNLYLVRRLKKCFRLNSKGELIRLRYMASNAKAGDIVRGSKHSEGYRVMGFENRILYVHRVVFALKHGYFPHFIDHKNRNPADNRLSNLRASSPMHNQKNRKLSKKNKSGINGIYFATKEKKWKIQLRENGKRLNLGTFKNLKTAKMFLIGRKM